MNQRCEACFLVPAVICVGLNPLAVAEVKQSYAVRYYDVPLGEYQYRQLVQHARMCVDGKRNVGCTKWDLRWSYKHRQDLRCVLLDFSIAVTGTIYMPKISEESLSNNPILRRAVDALLRHEEGHLDFPVQAAYRLEHEIEKIGDRHKTCTELGNFIDNIGNRLLLDAQQLERKYDAETNHGNKDGAIF